MPNTLAVRHPKGSGRIYAIFHPIAHRKSDASLGLKASVVFTVPAITLTSSLDGILFTQPPLFVRGVKRKSAEDQGQVAGYC